MHPSNSCQFFMLIEKLWWEQTHWRVSTLKMISPDSWVPTLFWQIIDKSRVASIDKSYTYLFELCCSENRVVTQYETDEAFLVAIRNKVSSEFLLSNFQSDGSYITNKAELEKVISSIAIGKIVLPQKFPFSELGISTLKQVQVWVEDQAKREDIYGKVNHIYKIAN
jgi:hypothetical protein